MTSTCDHLDLTRRSGADAAELECGDCGTRFDTEGRVLKTESSDPICTSQAPNPENYGLLRCTADTGHGPNHYFENSRGEIAYRWEGSGPARKVGWR